MATNPNKGKKWLRPFEFEEKTPPKRNKIEKKDFEDFKVSKASVSGLGRSNGDVVIGDQKNWMKKFDPANVEELAVHIKKIQEVEEWLKSICDKNCGEVMLLTGPVGCGKTMTLLKLADKYHIKVSEWITPLDIDIPTEYGDYEYRERQSTKFLDFLLNAANFTSLLDNNSRKIVLVEDIPNTFTRTPSEFTDVLQQYKQRAKSPIVFICSESHTDSKNSAANLFTQNIKDQMKIHHVSFNGVSATSMRTALKRVSDIMSKKHSIVYKTPTLDMIDCVVNSSTGDVRSAVLNLHFACLKGSSHHLETSLLVEKESKSKAAKNKKKSSKFLSIGKDQTVSILHGVGRVLNPKVTVGENGLEKLTHSPEEIIEQFVSQPISFINFLEENYLPHFSSPDHTVNAASALSVADFLLAEWREKMCQEYGLYTAVAGLMVANKAPISAWNPVKGPKNMKIQYPSPKDYSVLEQTCLYKGKVLVADFQTYCKIIGSHNMSSHHLIE